MKGRLLDLGLKDYGEVLKLQRELVENRRESGIHDTLILVEHPDVITLGRRGTMANVLSDKMPVYWIERGGDATYHGLGQLVGYPIVSLQEAKIDIISFVRKIEDLLIKTAADFGINSSRVEKNPGIWVGQKKLASIGIAVQHWITFHGFALNVNTDLKQFYTIKPCGMEPSTMTSMQRILGKEISLEKVKDSIAKNFSEVFQIELSEESIAATQSLTT